MNVVTKCHNCKPLLNCIASFIEAPSGLETIHQFSETNLKKGSRQPESALWALRRRIAVIKIIPRSNTPNLNRASCPFAIFLALSPSLSVPPSLSLYLTLCNSLTGTMLRCHPNIYSYHQDSSCWLERTTMIFCCASLGQHRFQLPKICI